MRFLIAKQLKRIFIIILIFLFFQGCTENLDPVKHPADMVFVNIDGTEDFTKIQMAIDDKDTLENYTVFVFSGEYKENIVINKSINLFGEDINSTIINANNTADGIRINVDNVNVSGFTIMNSGPGDSYPDMDAGIDIISINNNVSHCIFTNNSIGIYTNRAAQNYFYDNVFSHCTNYGMYLYSGSDSIMIKNNIFLKNSNYGLRVKGSDNTLVVGNLFMNNKRGMYFCCGANQNTVYYNSFINNTIWHADDYVGGNSWSNSEIQRGNFWDDHQIDGHYLFDNDFDGIIDAPYIIRIDVNGDIIQDLYPLKSPYKDHIKFL
jgi:parallel beta-helix repeat protein